MKTKNLILIILLIFIIDISVNYSQDESIQSLDVLYTIMDPNFPESGLNTTQVGSKVCHLGDINGDGIDDWAIGLGVAVDYGSGFQTGTVHIYFGGEIPESESPADLILAGEKDQFGFGSEISAAGDVNNDGYNDLLVKYFQQSAFEEEDTPSVALFYGGVPFDTEADLTFTAIEGHWDYWFGMLSDAGDVNNDSYDDILIGAPTDIGSADTGHVYIYYGGSTMDNNADVIFSGSVDPLIGAASFGASISGAGDVNNDGFDDILISAGGTVVEVYFGSLNMDKHSDVVFSGLIDSGTWPIVSSAGDVNNDDYADVLIGSKIVGIAYIYYGGEVPDDVADIILPGWAEWDYFGQSLSGAGDLNGDEIDDVIVGCDYDYAGQVRAYFGGTPMDSIPDIIMYGEVSGDRFGYTVSGGGDLDKDGYNDIIVGGIGNYMTIGGEDDQGNVSLFYGGESMDNEAEAIFTGISSIPYFGQRVSHAGDVNNDGYPDIIVGEPSFYLNGDYVGRAYLYFGSANPDNMPDITFMSETLSPHHNLGGFVSTAGDINNNGYSDVIIAETNPNDNNRKVYLHLGGEEMDSIPDLSFRVDMEEYQSETISAVKDVNNDGYEDICITLGEAYLYLGGETMDNIADVTFDSTNFSVSGAGNLNGDEFQDFIINGYKNDGTGVVKVFFGNSSISNTPQLVLGKDLGDYSFGESISAGHDINNDGYDDIVVSACFYDATYSGNEGRVYIYYGGESMDATPDVIITGDEVGLNLGRKVLTVPDLNADGYDDVLISHGSYIWEFAESAMYIYYGGGPMDFIPDIVLPYIFENDISVYSHPAEDYVGIIVGDPNISAVFIYTNSNLLGFSHDNDREFIPDDFTLNQNFPNPFNPMTMINYQLPITTDVELSVYNLLGQKVATLVSENQMTGFHQVQWDASDNANGVYYYQIKAGEFHDVKKMVLIK
jgi:hypothetical protein